MDNGHCGVLGIHQDTVMTQGWFGTGRGGLFFYLALSSATTIAAQGTSEQDVSHAQMNHYEHNQSNGASVPTLSGEYAFATLSEIVSILRAKSDTDWSTVDLAKLREHLVDMHNVTIDAHVTSEPIDGGARFDVTSESEEVMQSIRRMVGAHTEVMSSTGGSAAFRFSHTLIKEGVRLTVQSDTAQDALIIRALGFHGLMAEGDHHRQHHWMLATGHNPH